MKESLRLSVPTPCMEDWEKMSPAEKGRHCEQCCKTVVDFTGMSDGEVLNYFNGRLGGVCGRFAVDQLGRELAPTPVQRNGWKGWQLVVAGALVFGKGPGNGSGPGNGVGVGKGVVTVLGVPGKAVSATAVEERLTSEEIAPTTGIVMVEPDTSWMGVDTSKLVADTTKPVVMGKIAVKPKDLGHMGLVVIVPDTILATKMDTVSKIKVVVDSVVDLFRDTVASAVASTAAALNVYRPAEVVTVFPNPVVRGSLLRLGWKGGAGKYLVSMLSAGGSMVQERVVEVMGKGQVVEWVVPDGLAAGVYFLRVARPGEEGYTAKVVIQ